jgi:hypothetical protein
MAREREQAAEMSTIPAEATELRARITQLEKERSSLQVGASMVQGLANAKTKLTIHSTTLTVLRHLWLSPTLHIEIAPYYDTCKLRRSSLLVSH